MAATPKRELVSPVKFKPLTKPRMQDIPEEERPNHISARLRRNRPAVNYRASIARFNDDNAGNGLIMLVSNDEVTNAASLPDPKNRAEAMQDDEEGWAAAEKKELENHNSNKSFELIDRDRFERDAPGRRLVKLVWVYKRKRNGSLC